MDRIYSSGRCFPTLHTIIKPPVQRLAGRHMDIHGQGCTFILETNGTNITEWDPVLGKQAGTKVCYGYEGSLFSESTHP